MAYRTAWLIGSYADLPEQAFKVNGVDVVLPAGSYYLYDATDALSLLDAFVTALDDGGTTATVTLRQHRRIKLASLAAFTVTWGTATLLRDLLGFTGNLAGNNLYTAPNVSALLWSPQRTETPMLAPIGIRGQEVAAVYQSQSPYDGTTENTSRGAREYNRFIFRRVSYLRVWTDDNVGGEFNRWFKEVAVPAARWKLYSQVLESELDVQAEVNTGLGPYIVTAEKRGVNWDFVRSKGLEFTDRQMDIDFNVHVPPEYPG